MFSMERDKELIHGLTRQTEVDHSVKQVPFSCHTVQHLVQELCREKQSGFIFSGWAFLWAASEEHTWGQHVLIVWAQSLGAGGCTEGGSQHRPSLAVAQKEVAPHHSGCTRPKPPREESV